MLRHLTVLAAALPLALVGAPNATAAGPANDRVSKATVISAIPASVAVDTTGATSSSSDPGYCFGPELGPDPATVWFSYTPTTSGPPAQSVDVTLDPNGTLVRQQVVFHGTASCTAPTTFQSVVIVELDQGSGP